MIIWIKCIAPNLRYSLTNLIMHLHVYRLVGHKMSLPKAFKIAEDYFETSIKFFKQFQFLYNFPNTDVLLNNILDEIHVEDLENINIFEKDLRILATEDNIFLNEFYCKASKIHANCEGYKRNNVLEDTNTVSVPLGPKKKHEIVYLAREILVLCDKVGCNTVVDFGSGLGYLDQRIFETTSYKVLGLECNESHYVTAKKRQRKYHDNSLEKVKFIKHTITAESHVNISNYLEDKFGKGAFCITGLHSCADLTIDALNIFLKMEDAKALILMPCCYHKMQEVNGRFKNFPLSNCMRGIFEKYQAWEFMSVPFLRLGAQPKKVGESLENLVFNLLSRAVLQLYAHTHNCKIKRNKRKAVKTKAMGNNFENYLQNACQGFTLIKNDHSEETAQFDLDELRTIWQQITNSLIVKKAGIFIVLQNAIQELVENLILFDRLMFLRENGIERCGYKQILDDTISPRALALVAYK